MSTSRTLETRPSATLSGSAAGRWIGLLYGATVYAAFLGVFLALIGFVSGWVMPKTLDGPLPAGGAGDRRSAALVDVALLALFGIQHTIMARLAFKRWWTRFVPVEIERSTFVAITCGILSLMVWQWRPLPEVVWHVDAAWARGLLHGLAAGGWGLVLVATFWIDHFDLFGLKQVVKLVQRRTFDPPQFRTPALYGVSRHPLYLGFLIAFWSAPTMTLGHLLFSGVVTLYLAVAIRIEEASLVGQFGDTYREYRLRTNMILPLPRRAS